VAVRAVGAQFARYGAVGISNTLLSAAWYAALISLGADAVAAATIAFALGSVNGFLWNRRWTFAGRDTASPLRYVLVQAAGLAATDLLIGALDPALGHALAYLVTTGTVTLATFAANRRFSFPGTVYP
jgi:putative flippase GtrA